MFFKIDVLKNFALFTGKHPCWGSVFNKVADLYFIKKKTPAQVFFCEQCEIFKNGFL